MLKLQYGIVELEMSSRDDSNKNAIVKQGVIDEEEMKMTFQKQTNMIP